ncbi:MAG: hypothetical protein QXI19_09525 [Candidatus Caldarchaeum sp.]
MKEPNLITKNPRFLFLLLGIHMGIQLGGKIDISSALRSFPQEVQEELSNRSFPAFAARGDWLWEYPKNKKLYIIISSGVVKVTKHADKKNVIRFVVGPGAILAVSAFPTPLSKRILCIAATPCSFIKISSSKIQNHPRLLQAFNALALQQKDFLKKLPSHVIEGLSSQDPNKRIASALISLSMCCGEDTACGRKISLPLTEADIAEAASASIEETKDLLSDALMRNDIVACGEHLCINHPDLLIAQIKGRHSR